MKKSRRYFLKPCDYDENLVKVHMMTHNLGGYSREDLILDPSEVTGSEPHETAERIQKEHKRLLEKKAENINPEYSYYDSKKCKLK